MARYLDGEHHPQKALAPRVAYVVLEGTTVVGYIGGHETHRYKCDGELQYLYVVPRHRRSGVGSELLMLLAAWFTERDLARVCVGAEKEDARARAFLARHGAVDLNASFLVWSDIAQVLP